ncbi:hypothetical protein ZHAS_00007773 [Anopheles sinensis]|uniref:Uncharacterized protein n=1 Tax=Anopheles sinensis TaxID=74873 RepID=A0A084VQM0_ANOSI|nr:hypothetical protein ZHAS_00007773 [Anopheles sinensis]
MTPSSTSRSQKPVDWCEQPVHPGQTGDSDVALSSCPLVEVSLTEALRQVVGSNGQESGFRTAASVASAQRKSPSRAIKGGSRSGGGDHSE